MIKKILLLFFILSSSYIYSQNISVTNFINEWIGKPYLYGGETKKGIDCSALVQKFYKQVYNVSIPRTCYYIFNTLKSIDINELNIGDILMFKSKLSPSGWHTGVYIGNDQFLHASNYKEGVKISCLYDSIYQKNLKGVKRY